MRRNLSGIAPSFGTRVISASLQAHTVKFWKGDLWITSCFDSSDVLSKGQNKWLVLGINR